MKLHHNKKRNTLFLYEVLIRELTKSIMEENSEKKKKITNILKSYFSKGKLLAEEMSLYRTLSDTSELKEQTARSLLQEVLRTYNNFDLNKVYKEQEEVVSKMNKELEKEVFMTYVPNYRNLATIYQLFNRKLNPKERILLEEKIIESLIAKKVEVKEDTVKPISNLAFKTFVKSFNQSYSGELIKEQQELLAKYILSCVDNGTELRIYLNEEIGRLKDSLKLSIIKEENIKNDVEMTNKTKEVLEILESFRDESEVSPLILERLLRIQKLVREIEDN